MNPPQRCLPVLYLWVLSLSLGCDTYPSRTEIPFELSAPLDGIEAVSVETRNGAIEVRAEPGRAEAAIQGSKSARGKTEEDARSFAERIKIEAIRDPDDASRLRIVARFPAGESDRSLAASIVVALPPRMALAVQTRNGAVQVEGMSGKVGISTRNGRIEVRSVKGDLEGRTRNGAVEAREITGDVLLRSSNGKIVATGIVGNADLETSNGSVRLVVVSAPEEPEVSAKTSNCSVVVEVPRNLKASLDMKTSHGKVNCNLQNVESVVQDSSPGSLQATLNGGGGSIRIRSSNGSVSFETRD